MKLNDDELLGKYEIWEKVRNSIKEEFGSEPAYDEKYLRTKIKSYNEKIKTNFHNNKTPKEGSQCIGLSVILIDSAYTKDKNYYPQVFLEECKYVVKDKKTSKLIIEDIEISSDDSDNEINTYRNKYRNIF